MVEYAYKENGVLKLKPVAMSLSQAQIDEITTELLEAMQPDWQNAVAMPSNFNGYVAPENGMIVGWGTRNGNGNVQISINGVIVARGDSANSIYAPASIQCIVNKGDVITTSTTIGSAMSFVPFKTSNPVSLRPIDKTKIDAAIVQHWDDITSDFSTAGSASGFVLEHVKYNSVLQQLKLYVKKTSAGAASTTFKLYLQYNGSENIVFGDNTIAFMNHVGPANGHLAGMEVGTAIVASNKLQIDIYNRNGSNAWAANDTYRGVIWL